MIVTKKIFRFAFVHCQENGHIDILVLSLEITTKTKDEWTLEDALCTNPTRDKPIYKQLAMWIDK